MKRLTSDKPVTEMGVIELAHNSCYRGEDGWARYRDYDIDMDARDLTRNLMVVYGVWDSEEDKDLLENNQEFDRFMSDCPYGITDEMEGLIMQFYKNTCAMADLRERLKYYEDLEGHGTLLKLPCAVGDTVWYWDKEYDPIEEAPFEGYVSGYEIVSAKTVYIIIVPKTKTPSWIPHDVKLGIDDFGKTVFLTREEAEATLKEL